VAPFMICVTHAREIPSRRAISARDATSLASSCRCHSSARARRAADPLGSKAMPACSRFLARAKSTTRHVAKFLFEADLGSREVAGFVPDQPCESRSDDALPAHHSNVV
jgi:hypothetical protein